jgi:hypothetical protein
MSVPFEHRQGDVADMLDIAVEPGVLEHIVFADEHEATTQARSLPGSDHHHHQS